jgi:UDP-N-acetylglucosamine 4-epimerase
VEQAIGQPLSPYALTKHVNEQYAAIFARSYGCASIGLRYFSLVIRTDYVTGACASYTRYMRSLRFQWFN